jgi:intraflagellar transport protein 80
MLSLSNDTIAVVDVGVSTAGSTVRFFDTAQGRPIGEPFTHSLDIKEIALSQVGSY